jgi:hypothetical protein
LLSFSHCSLEDRARPFPIQLERLAGNHHLPLS